MSERNQNKCRVTLCNGIIKGWLYCLTSESKERFFVNNILFGSAWCLVIVQIQFSLIKEKIGRPEHFSNPPAPFKEDVMCITPSVWNATDSFTRRKWRKRNPCIARCVMNFIKYSTISEIEQTNWDFSLVIFLFTYVIISPPPPP